jgi:predicted flap endonuclease-1-like 5' DNA nuclease
MTGPIIFIIISLTGAFIIGWISSWIYGKNQIEELSSDLSGTQNKLRESLYELERTHTHINELKSRLSSPRDNTIDSKEYAALKSQYEALERDCIELERRLALNGNSESRIPNTNQHSFKIDKLSNSKGLLEEMGLSITGEVQPKIKDDLTCIKGISPFIQDRLYRIGIVTYDQISRLNDEQANLVNDAIEVLPGRIRKERWVTQCLSLVLTK